MYLPHSHAVMKYSKNPKLAKDFLKWVHSQGELREVVQTRRRLLGRRHPRLGEPPDVGEGRQAAADVPHSGRNTRIFGYAGPATAKATEAFTKYIVTDMYAKAVQGMKAEDAVKWAEGELKKVYES